MPGLRTYREKRDPDRTPEPFGDERPDVALPPGAPRAFVVQQHAARSMHWDLRLEVDGVLVSWAVPRGPSLDPREKRLALRTEDHPVEYAAFEGVIPPGNYGAGAMIVWDRGAYHTVDGVSPADGVEQGKLDLQLDGHKLLGRFALVRTRGEGGKSWLLLRKGELPEGDEELVDACPRSVLSGLRVDQVRDGVSFTAELEEMARSTGAPKRSLDPAALDPMLASRADAPFSRDGWLYELKYDGVRVLGGRCDGEVWLRSRAGRDVRRLYPEVTEALSHLPVDEFALDGEVVALDATGRSSFERIARRFTQSDPGVIARQRVDNPVVFYAFDLLSVAGRDLRGRALETRKAMLARFCPARGLVRFVDHVEGDGLALWEAVRSHDLEGMVAKRADSKYETGRRSKAWQKLKVPRVLRLAIAGYVPTKGTRGALGSLMLVGRRGDALAYVGNVGSGLDQATCIELSRRLDAARLDAPAFEGGPERPPAGAVFSRPELVCEVRFTEVTGAGMLRHPVFVRLLPDADPSTCEAPALSAEEGAQPVQSAQGEQAASAPPRVNPALKLTRLDKVFWPVEGYTKGDLLAYYEAAWPFLEPYLRDRPVVLTRYPDGIEGKSFYQKNAPDFTPDWARREQIEGTDYFVCDDLRTLLYVINSGSIPLHVWSARLSAIERPDWMILDLDPKEAPFRHVVRIARHIHALLDELDARHFVKTSGQDGLHVLVPLGGRLEHRDARQVAELLARVVCAELPDIATIARPLAARGERVYVDFGQNGHGRLIAAPLSVRPRPAAPVSMPLRWSQVTARLDPARWTIKTAVRRLEREGDPVLDVLGEPVDVDAVLAALAERL